MLVRLLLFSLIWLAAAPALADDRARDHEAARAALLRRKILPITTILNIATKAVAGEVIAIDLERVKHGGFEYEVRILAANGRVIEVELDARTGAILSVEDD